MAARRLVAAVALLGAFAAGAFTVQLGVLPGEDRLPWAGGPATSAPAAVPTTAPLETPQPRPAPETNPRGLASCSGIARWAAMRQPVAVAVDPCPRWLEVSILRLAMSGRWGGQTPGLS
jgi:hypothetical protein